MNNLIKACVLTAAGFLVGSHVQTMFDKAQVKKAAPALLEQVRQETWTVAFHAGWESAVDSPTVRLKHYHEFKEANK